MCQHIIILAADDAAHRIAQCEHGTIHLFWVRVNIFLIPEDLLNLLALLQSWKPNQPYAESEGFAVRRMAGGYVQLWCACAGLLLFEHELMQLRDLLWRAAGKLQLLNTAPRRPTRHWLDEYLVMTEVAERNEARN